MNRKLFYIVFLTLLIISSSTTILFASETFTILNPRASKAPIIAQSLAPRLPNLDGKTIAIVASSASLTLADPEVRPYGERTLLRLVGEEIAKTASNVKVLYITPENIELDAPLINTTHITLEEFNEDPTVADAVIVGHGF